MKPPIIRSVTATAFPTAATSHPVNMPAIVKAGDLLLMLWTNESAATVTRPAGWSQNAQVTTGSGGTAIRSLVISKRADGSEGGTAPDVVTSATCEAVAQVFVIDGNTWPQRPIIATLEDPLLASGGTGSSANPDNPVPGTAVKYVRRDVLWIAAAHWDTDAAVSVWPTNYNTRQLASSSSAAATAVTVASCCRVVASTALENPSAYTIGSSQTWHTWTIEIRGADYKNLRGRHRHARNYFSAFPRSSTPQRHFQRKAADTSGATNLTNAGAIASAEAFGTAKVTPTNLTAAGGIASAQAVGTAVVTRGAVTLTGAGAIASAQAVGTATVTVSGGVQSLTAAGGIASAEAFGTATLTQPVAGARGGKPKRRVTPFHVGPMPDMRPTPPARQKLAWAGGIPSAEVFGVPAIRGDDSPDDLAIFGLIGADDPLSGIPL